MAELSPAQLRKRDCLRRASFWIYAVLAGGGLLRGDQRLPAGFLLRLHGDVLAGGRRQRVRRVALLAPPHLEIYRFEEYAPGFVTLHPFNPRWKVIVTFDAETNFIARNQWLGRSQLKASTRQIDNFDENLAPVGVH